MLCRFFLIVIVVSIVFRHARLSSVRVLEIRDSRFEMNTGREEETEMSIDKDLAVPWPGCTEEIGYVG